VIELQMVRRMAKRGVVLAALVAVVLLLVEGPFYAWSSLVGSALTVANLWFAARLIGSTAENNPKMLLPVGLATFTGGLLALTAISAVLMLTDLIYFPATGFTLIGMHFALVLSEAAGSAKKNESTKIEPSRS
jgi:phosphoglycerol transferase MdoB-like AlkP superfamily enzyme